MADVKAESFTVLRITMEDRNSVEQAVAREFPVTIIFNNQELVTLLCSPADLKYLTVGFLASEGFLNNKDEIRKITVDEKRGVVRLETTEDKVLAADALVKRVISSGCGRGPSFYSPADAASRKVDSMMTISAADIFSLVKEFQHGSQLYLATHGVHNAALCDGKRILVFSEDIGRHNAVDKIFGRCLLENINTDNHAMITTGRVSSEIIHKVARRNIPIVISISAPTSLGVRLADTLGITLVTSVRGRKMNIFSHDWRVT
ncbi:MAG: formate dehydrogenase accessory sulfurtransferase FdhD [Dehalococcoidales bacterium]|nr:formate dehydrogenase accessory sulfurtransferase FdhD [Dehalococcoidales bacterium]